MAQIEATTVVIDVQMLKKPIKVKTPVVSARRIAITEQIIKSVSVQLAGYDLRQVGWNVCMFSLLLLEILVKKDLKAIGKVRTVATKSSVNLC